MENGWKLFAMIAVSGTVVGGGAGTLTGALAGEERVRQMIAASPEIVVVRTIQSEIRNDVAALSEEQRATQKEVSEINRKLDRLLFIVEEAAGP